MKIKIQNLFFLLTGLTTLFSLPFMGWGGLTLWIIIKSSYFLGIIFFIIQVVKENKKI